MKRVHLFLLRLPWALFLLLVTGLLIYQAPEVLGNAVHKSGQLDASTTGVITGTVTDANGNPLEGIWVSAGGYVTLTTCGGGDTYGSASSPSGAFQLNVPPGTFLVFVNSHHQPGHYIPEAYPDVNSWRAIASAAHVTVASGQIVTGVNFSLPPGLTVSGRLVNDQGQPVTGAGGHVQDYSGAVEFGCALGFGSSDTDGTFQFNVPTGGYELVFCASGECHQVRRNLIVTSTLALGDVLFADEPRLLNPRPLEPDYTVEWFVAPGAFHMPQQLLRTPEGDLWVLAVRSQTLFRLSASGTITPVATGLAAYVGDMDASGNAYLYGHPQGIIYRVTPTGTKTVVIQSPELQIACDSAMGIGPDGNLYVAPYPCAGTAELIRVTPGGTLTHVASGLPNLVAMRTAPDGRFLAAADNRVYQLSLSDYVLTLLGQLPTCCVSPSGLAADDAGNIYLSTGSRQTSGQLYRMAPGGQVTLLANIPMNGLSGLVWLPDTHEVAGGQLRQGVVLAVGTDGSMCELVPGNGLVSPMGMAFSPEGELAVANDDGGMMTRVDRQGQVAWFFDYISFTPPMPFVTYAPNGSLYAGEGAPGFVGRIITMLPQTFTPTHFVYADWPSGLALDSAGRLLASETRLGRITQINSNHTTVTVAAGLAFPQALALDAAGQLYAVTGAAGAELDETFPVPSTGDTIVRITPTGQVITLTTARNAAALVVGPDGDLYAAMGERVAHITSGGVISPFADGFFQAMGLAFDVEGNLYISDAEGDGIARIRGFPRGTVSGRVTTFEGAPLPGAYVSVLSTQPIVAGQVITANAGGRFQVAVAPRTYTITASALDYWPATQPLTVTAGQTVTVNLVLYPSLKVYLPVVLK